MDRFTITSDDPVGPKLLRLWAFERRLLIDRKKLADTGTERARIADARALADAWEGQATARAPARPGFLSRILGRS